MILAWLGAALIGLSLGLLGSGGSILTVPVLVYLVGEESKLAITESLAIVGTISLFGMLPYAVSRQIQWEKVLLFGLPGMLGTYFGSALSQYLSGGVQLTIFAVVMLLAATFMFRSPLQKSAEVALPTAPRPPLKTALEGLAVGILTGLVGVGGGFLIVPALVLLGGLPMQYAVGTSLMIITLNSFMGFFKHLYQFSGSEHGLHWSLIALFAVIGVLGSFAGTKLSQNISSEKLRKGFAASLVVIGLYVLGTNVSKALHPNTTVRINFTIY